MQFTSKTSRVPIDISDEFLLIRISTTGLNVRSIGVSKKALDRKVRFMHKIKSRSIPNKKRSSKKLIFKESKNQKFEIRKVQKVYLATGSSSSSYLAIPVVKSWRIFDSFFLDKSEDSD